MLATIRLSSGTGGTTVVGDGINVGHCTVGRWLVAVGTEDIVRVGVEGDIVATESAVPDAQAPSPTTIKRARNNPDLEMNLQGFPLFKRRSPLRSDGLVADFAPHIGVRESLNIASNQYTVFVR